MAIKKVKKLAYPHNHFEKMAWTKGQLVCGIDEAGRGSLAGPVMVAAVILPANTSHPLLKDSKTMSEKQRNTAYAWIIEHCKVTVIAGPHTQIDAVNIYQATKQCMHQAFKVLLTHNNITTEVAYIVADAIPLSLNEQYTKLGITGYSFNYGESISASIAAASIVAKVTRDALMNSFDKLFPAFNFAKHKGYGTAEHLAKLRTHGLSIIHRKTFTHNYQEPLAIHSKQESLFS